MENVMCKALGIGNVPCAFVALDHGRWKRGTAQFRDTRILLDGDAVVVTLVVAQVF